MTDAEVQDFDTRFAAVFAPNTTCRSRCRSFDNKNCAIYVIMNCLALMEAVMNVSIGQRWEDFVDRAVKTGRYGSASEVVREGLRLVEEREAKLLALKKTIDESITRGGENSDEDVDLFLDEAAADLAKQGY